MIEFMYSELHNDFTTDSKDRKYDHKYIYLALPSSKHDVTA